MEISSSDCSCPDTRPGICKHRVALLLAVADDSVDDQLVNEGQAGGNGFSASGGAEPAAVAPEVVVPPAGKPMPVGANDAMEVEGWGSLLAEYE